MANSETAIIGGGISGLMAALAAAERGEKNITVYEASDRFGGKMQTAQLDGKTINMGPEFIDEENTRIRDLAKKIGVRLKTTGDQSTEVFQSPNGKMMPNFIEEYKPIANKIIKLREQMENDPELVERMKSMSAKELVKELVATTEVVERPSPLTRIYNFFTFNNNRVSQEVADTAVHSMVNELGASGEHITAKQFISETSPEANRFLASTCDYRVDENQDDPDLKNKGTLALAEALKKHLKDKYNVNFETNHKLVSLQKDGDEKVMVFATGDGEKTIRSGKTVIALPAYALPKIKGMEFLGIDENSVQYTKNAKITVKVREGVKLPTQDANAFLKDAEVWNPYDGMLTFLPHNENGDSPAKVMARVLNGYAAAYGMKAEDLFYIENGRPVAGTFVYTNPGEAACWSTPNPQTARRMEQLFAKMEAMSDQGLAFVGTYLPLDDGGVGFMECGAASVERIAERMFGQVRHAEHEVQLAQHIQPPHHSFANKVRQDGAHTGHAI